MEEDIFTRIKSNDATIKDLELLKSQLREDSFRSSDIVKNNLANWIQYCNNNITNEILRDLILSVNINLLARNEYNRSFFTNSNEESIKFWKSIIKIWNETDLVLYLLLQFIYETEKSNEYVRYFHDLNLHIVIYESFIEFENIDIIYEIIIANNDRLDDYDKKFINSSFQYMKNYHESGKFEEIDQIFDILAYADQDEDLFLEIANSMDSASTDAKFNRKLLVLAVDIYPGGMDLSNDFFKADNYKFILYCIIYGNEIHDKESSDIVFKDIDSKFGINKLINKFFKQQKITDVVQLQAIHLWTNLMNESIANEILNNYQKELSILTKIIIDNHDYYKEITALYSKFLKKLFKFTSSNTPTELLEQVSTNTIPEMSSARYVVIQKLNYDSDDSHFIGYLIDDCTKKINHLDLLEQIKTLSILNNHILQRKIIIVDQMFGFHLYNLLKELYNHSLKLSENSWNEKFFKNNLKYLAASTLQVFEDVLDPNEDISTICNTIINS